MNIEIKKILTGILLTFSVTQFAQATLDVNHLLSAINNGDVATIVATSDEDAIFKHKGPVLIRAALEGIYKKNPELGKAVIKALLDKSLRFLDVNDPEVKALLHLASASGCVELVQGLLAHGVDKNAVSQAGQTALHLAVQMAQLEVAKVLLAHGIDPNVACSLGLTALHLAGINGDKDLVNLLLKCGAKAKAVCKEGWTALRYAEREGHAEVVKLLKHL